ncbi:MAG: hypothetical protein FJ119_14330, partial [Deltaproteobacteria bacterium]|nr:hypothetical protein [Deltaproteobacteria bacterium]
MNIQTIYILLFALPALFLPALSGCSGTAAYTAGSGTGIKAATPPPRRFVVRGHEVIDTASDKTLFFKGMGYSPFMPGESPLRG